MGQPSTTACTATSPAHTLHVGGASPFQEPLEQAGPRGSAAAQPKGQMPMGPGHPRSLMPVPLSAHSLPAAPARLPPALLGPYRQQRPCSVTSFPQPGVWVAARIRAQGQLLTRSTAPWAQFCPSCCSAGDGGGQRAGLCQGRGSFLVSCTHRLEFGVLPAPRPIATHLPCSFHLTLEPPCLRGYQCSLAPVIDRTGLAPSTMTLHYRACLLTSRQLLAAHSWTQGSKLPQTHRTLHLPLLPSPFASLQQGTAQQLCTGLGHRELCAPTWGADAPSCAHHSGFCPAPTLARASRGPGGWH